MRLVSAPTGVFTIVGRLQVDGAADLPAANALQDQFTLIPLTGGSSRAAEDSPEHDPRVHENLLWWERFRVALAAFPPPAADAQFIELARSLGPTATESPCVDPDRGLAEVLVPGAAAGQQKIEELGKGGGQDEVNGWSNAMHMFDYNLERLGLGTIDTPAWKIADRSTAYVTRAVAARAGLWGNNGYEANYAFVWTDEDGDALNGADHAYELRLAADSTGGRVLVTDDVRNARLLPRRQPDRPLLDR